MSVPMWMTRRQRPIWKTSGIPLDALTSTLNVPSRLLDVEEMMWAVVGRTDVQVSHVTLRVLRVGRLAVLSTW